MANRRGEAVLPCFLPLIALVISCSGERVHFRIQAGDVLDQHTHTRTVLLHPDSETLKHLRQLHQMPAQSMVYYHGVPPLGPIRPAPQQAVSFMRQTLQLPLQSQPQTQPPRPAHGPGYGHNPVPGLGATRIQQVPVMPIIPLVPIAGGGQPLSAPGHVVLPTGRPHPAVGVNPASASPPPARVTTKKTQTSLVTHQMSGPGPWPTHVLLPHGPKGELVPMRLLAVAHSRPGGKMSAALLAAPSAADLKKGKGCKAFIKAGEDPDVGDCFLEEYENGYNEEHSNKKFFGRNHSDGKHEKQGARNTKRYKNDSKYVHHPKVKNQWLRTPNGEHHLISTEVAPLFTPAAQGGKSGKRGRVRGSNPDPRPNKVTVVRLPPGATAVTTVLRGQANQDDQLDSLDEDDDEKGTLQDEEMDQSLDPQHREEEDGLVEVFKHSARVRAPLMAVRPAKSVWVQQYHPVRIKQVDPDEDQYEVEESAPVHVAMSPEMAMMGSVMGLQTRGPLHPMQPRALDDMDDGWTSGFTDSVFDSGDHDEKADMEAEVNSADFDHGMDDDDHKDAAEQRADGDYDDEQDHAATNDASLASHPILTMEGPAERMLHRRGGGQSNSDQLEDSQRLSDILAPATPPAPHPAAFGAKDPDRLESGRKAPVVLEFGHELSGYKVTREREQKKWR